MQLLLLKRGGQTIYNGPLGERSHHLIEYFEVWRQAGFLGVVGLTLMVGLLMIFDYNLESRVEHCF
jgi:hypothetical protein